MERVDIAVVGGGIAGASAAAEMAAERSVVLLEREGQPAYHTSGRSAALFCETYGNAVVRGLSVGSRAFLREPPPGFADAPLLSPRGALMVGRADQSDLLDREAEAGRALVPDVRRLSADEVRALVPVLGRDWIGGVLEPGAMDIDTHATVHGFLRLLRARGGRAVMDAEVRAIGRASDGWRIETPAGTFLAEVVVDAAGAWADALAEAAGVRPAGVVPKRRTAFLFDPPDGVDAGRWPMLGGVDESFYFKPDAGKIMGSPADETPSPPTDAQPEELDVAVAVDRIERATTMRIGRISHRWAGLRSFAADKTPVVGFAPDAEGFFWLAGQGGYGFQTCAAMARTAAALVMGRPVPADLQDLGVTAAALSPARFG
jgi:D-arginine dehydrogenase